MNTNVRYIKIHNIIYDIYLREKKSESIINAPYTCTYLRRALSIIIIVIK